LEAPQKTGRSRDYKPSEAENKGVREAQSKWEAHTAQTPSQWGSKKETTSRKVGVPENPRPGRGRPRESGSPKSTGDGVRGSREGQEPGTGGSEDEVPWTGGGPRSERGGPAPQTEGSAQGRPTASTRADTYSIFLHTQVCIDMHRSTHTAIS